MTKRRLWSPDKVQWFLIWIGFLLASYAIASDSIGVAFFLAGVFGLLIYYRETLRQARKAEEDAEKSAEDQK